MKANQKKVKTSEKSIIKFLKKYYLINKNKYQDRYVLPRPLSPSILLEAEYRYKHKPETLQALKRIQALNKKVVEEYLIADKLIEVEEYGKTYSVTINKKVIDEINKINGYA